MRVDRLPGAKVITPILWVVLIGGLATVIFLHRSSWQPATIDVERTTLSLLKSEPVRILVVRRTTTQIVVEYEEENWLGHWQGVLWGVVQMHYGIDLDKVSKADLRRDGETVVVALPEPQLLTFTVEPGSVGLMTKSTAAPKIADMLHNGHRRLLEERLRERAMEFAKGHDLMPSKAQIVRELNEAVASFGDSGLKIRFE
ncbi:MAG: DUF4230 domain-containing protein [Planctomycetota bacterium]|nr:DUF4230 domain-containing protein [Planctomycetota bacterium]